MALPAPRLQLVTTGQVLEPYTPATPEPDALVSVRSSAHVHQESLTKQGNAVLGNLFVNAQQVYLETTAHVLDMQAAVRSEEHAELVADFFHKSLKELGTGLIENYRLAEAQVKRVTNAPLPINPPQERQAPVRSIERRNLAFAERFTGKTYEVHYE